MEYLSWEEKIAEETYADLTKLKSKLYKITTRRIDPLKFDDTSLFLVMDNNFVNAQCFMECVISVEQKREKKETKKGTTSESRCVIILSSKLGHSPRALF